MNILFYIPDLKKEFGGVWQYSTNLLKTLSPDQSNKYFIYYNAEDPEMVSLLKTFPNFTTIKTADIIQRSNYGGKLAMSVINKIARRLHIRKEFTTPTVTDLICMRYQIDIIHCPVQYIPVTAKAKLITTLHDVQEIHFPEYFSAEDRAYRANAYLDFVRRATAVVVSYDHIRKDLIKYFQVDEKKIRVILLDMQKLWFERFREDDIADISFLGIPEKFMLYPASTWKHKNHLRLIEAVLLAKEKDGVVINLVCTGNKEANYTEIENLVKANNLQSQVYFTGIVKEDTLYSLYKKCRGVVIPTLYEAGSFPLIESILLNVPVICSNVTSLPETMGSEDFIFDPFDTDDISKRMTRLWVDDSFRDRNITHIKSQVGFIRKNNALQKIMDMYSSI